jgi:hypothetical protein
MLGRPLHGWPTVQSGIIFAYGKKSTVNRRIFFGRQLWHKAYIRRSTVEYLLVDSYWFSSVFVILDRIFCPSGDGITKRRTVLSVNINITSACTPSGILIVEGQPTTLIGKFTIHNHPFGISFTERCCTTGKCNSTILFQNISI